MRGMKFTLLILQPVIKVLFCLFLFPKWCGSSKKKQICFKYKHTFGWKFYSNLLKFRKTQSLLAYKVRSTQTQHPCCITWQACSLWMLSAMFTYSCSAKASARAACIHPGMAKCKNLPSLAQFRNFCWCNHQPVCFNQGYCHQQARSKECNLTRKVLPCSV